jgi:flagellar hook-length control protein FliK
VRPAAKDAQPEGTKEVARTPADFPRTVTQEPVIPAARPPIQPPAAVIADSAASRAAVQSVGEQILDSVHASLAKGDRQVLVRLHPPELGTIVVRFREDGQQVNAVLEVARGDTRREVERALPGVLRGLQDAGVQIRRFEVVASELPERDFARGQPQQDGWTQHQSTGQDRGHSSPSPHVRWAQARSDPLPDFAESSTGASRISPATGRIDMLL